VTKNIRKMVVASQGADASSRQYDDAEGRLSLQEVPDKISRIFFGDPQKEYQQGTAFEAAKQFKNYVQYCML
jgi:hypothetical protein